MQALIPASLQMVREKGASGSVCEVVRQRHVYPASVTAYVHRYNRRFVAMVGCAAREKEQVAGGAASKPRQHKERLSATRAYVVFQRSRRRCHCCAIVEGTGIAATHGLYTLFVT